MSKLNYGPKGYDFVFHRKHHAYMVFIWNFGSFLERTATTLTTWSCSFIFNKITMYKLKTRIVNVPVSPFHVAM
jgi:hypothetical protein